MANSMNALFFDLEQRHGVLVMSILVRNLNLNNLNARRMQDRITTLVEKLDTVHKVQQVTWRIKQKAALIALIINGGCISQAATEQLCADINLIFAREFPGPT